MSHYQSLLIADPGATKPQVEAAIARYKDLVEAHGGKVETTEMWGVKSLAYRIRKNRKAHFTLLNIDAPPAALAEMERQMRISEDVLRFLTVRVDALEGEPSAMMQKRDRDERKDRKRGGPRNDEDKDKKIDVQAALDTYSAAILDELRQINDHIETKLHVFDRE